MYRNNKWSNDEINLLIELYPIKSNEELVNYFEGRTETSIYYKAKRLGLNKKYDWRYNNLSNIIGKDSLGYLVTTNGAQSILVPKCFAIGTCAAKSTQKMKAEMINLVLKDFNGGDLV